VWWSILLAFDIAALSSLMVESSVVESSVIDVKANAPEETSGLQSRTACIVKLLVQRRE
jgi:hypothetical protein